MNALTRNFIAQVLGGSETATDTPIGKITTDSRAVAPGDVFFALKGERFDGHDFVDQVLQQGAALCVVSRPDMAQRSGCLNVADTEQALGQLAAAWRRAVNPQLTLFGITGSSGKTTVKEILAAIVRAQAGEAAVLATAGNFNNHIGLPLTLLQLTPQHRYAVMEMGMNHFGELDYLTRIAAPDFALINNALRAHIGCGFDGVADIARAKSEIYHGLGAHGIGFYPAEDTQAALFQAALAGKKARSFGIEAGDIRAEQLELQPLSSRFEIVAPDHGRLAVNLAAPGRHNVHNAVAAAALALAAGVSQEAVAQGLGGFSNIKGRLQQKQGINGARIIDDTYNANPDSMKAAVDVLAAFAAPRVLVMGAMGELGDHAPALHAEVGAYARAQGIEHALFLGDDARHACDAFGAGGQFFEARADLAAALLPLAVPDATVLVKGSRFMKMEDIVAALTGT